MAARWGCAGILFAVSARLRAIARETVEIAERGSYRTGDGVESVREEIAAAVAGTRVYEPDEVLRGLPTRGGDMRIEVTNESSLGAARRLTGATADGWVACLVFGSARNPAGGFLNGAQAQEESIARGSALYACQRAVPEFYAYHRAHPDLTYSDRVIYSPGVPVFRDEDDNLLPAARLVAFLTAAAPNRAAIARSQPEHLKEIPAILRHRAVRVLDVAAQHGHSKLVLGAWGCGVFGNDPTTVATAFAAALEQNRSFDRVTFAVLDRQRGTPTYDAFAEVFGVTTPS